MGTTIWLTRTSETGRRIWHDNTPKKHWRFSTITNFQHHPGLIRTSIAVRFVVTRRKHSSRRNKANGSHEGNSFMKTSNKLNGWIVVGTALISCAAASLMAVGLTHANETRVDSNRVFELRIYHTVPGKVSALEAVFRDASKVMANHGINVVGYWVPNEDRAWKDTFIYIVAHSSRGKAKENWDALHADPVFQPYVEAAKPLIDKAGKVFRVDAV